MPRFSDIELRAFLDGNVSSDQEAEILAALEGDPDLERRLMKMDQTANTVSEAFQSVTPNRPAEDFLPAPSGRTLSVSPNVRLFAAACVGGLLLIGGYLGLSTANSDIRPWMHQVAAYQALYSADTISMVAHSPAEIAEQLARSEAALKIDLNGDTLSKLSGLALKRAQLLAFEGQPLSQIVFAGPAGQPIALCVFKDSGGTKERITYTRLEGLESASFSVGSYSFLLIGPVDKMAIETYAHQIRKIFT